MAAAARSAGAGEHSDQVQQILRFASGGFVVVALLALAPTANE
jgi:hypothetical protein